MIYLIRHGQTEFNRENRVQGRIDSPLTELGVAQARAMAERLRSIKANDDREWRITTSPLGRARRTAEIVAEAVGLATPHVDERLIEVDYGQLEGLTRGEVDVHWPRFIGVEGVFGQAPGGETMDDLTIRIGGWLGEARAAAETCRTIAVSHVGVIRVLRGLYLGLGTEAMRAMDKPQDVIFQLHGGAIDRFECAVLP